MYRRSDTKSIGEILIVEDTLESLQLLRDLLSEAGYSVRLAQDGALALSSLQARAPDLILLDIRMPYMDGYEVCQRIKSNPIIASIPVIFLSALQDKESLLKGFEMGAVDYISKPYLAEEVLARVHTHIELQRLRVDLEGIVKARTQQLEEEILERKEIEMALLDSQKRLQDLSVYLEDVREKERARIAHELHDELGQAFTVMRMDLIRLSERSDFNQNLVKDKLNSFIKMLDQVANTARSISENLRPGMLDVLGLSAAVQTHVEKFMSSTGIACELSMTHDEFELDDKIATALFRIVQESMTNAAKYAEAKKLEIQIFGMKDAIVVVVQDDGVGLAKFSENPRGFGMIGMQERARALGGKLVVESELGHGTRIEAYIPLILESKNA